MDIDLICTWLSDTYWARDRDRVTIERSIAHSFPYAAYDPSGRQVGFTRATSDLASFCWIGDVIVSPTNRGRGVGTWLVGAAIDDVKTRGVHRFLLATRDAHGVYERLGFTPLQVPAVWMERDERALRPRPGDASG